VFERKRFAAAALVVLATPCSHALAQTNTANGPATAAPFIVNGVYDGGAFVSLRGGVRSGSTYTGNLHLHATGDLGAIHGPAETTIYADVLWIHGGQPSQRVGDAQGVSNIAAPSAVKPEELWIERNFAGDRLSILAGIFDLNAEFYRLHSATLFVNGSFGVGPEFSQSGTEGPSIFPRTSPGFRVAVKPVDNVVLRAALLNGVPLERPDGTYALHREGDGALVVVEAAILDRKTASQPRNARFRIGREESLPPYERKLALGAWHYSASFPDLVDVEADGTPRKRRGSDGAYALFDAMLARSPSIPERNLFGFVELGLGDRRVDRFGAYVGAGLVAKGALATRTDDELGLSLAHARSGTHYRLAQNLQGLPVTSAESTVELTYLAQVSGSLAIQPDLQYVVRPNSDPRIRNAVAFQLRFEVSY